MNQVSAKQASLNRQKSLLKKTLLNECGHICKCGSTYLLDLSHIIPVGREKQYEVLKLNLVIDCRNCHNIWEHGTWEEKEKLPDFYSRLKKIRIIDMKYFNKISISIPEWILEKFEALWT
jgi:5-methylcytosine-specific restriction endonuclease McrA